MLSSRRYASLIGTGPQEDEGGIQIASRATALSKNFLPSINMTQFSAMSF
jgi:hypothetical protein